MILFARIVTKKKRKSCTRIVSNKFLVFLIPYSCLTITRNLGILLKHKKRKILCLHCNKFCALMTKLDLMHNMSEKESETFESFLAYGLENRPLVLPLLLSYIVWIFNRTQLFTCLQQTTYMLPLRLPSSRSAFYTYLSQILKKVKNMSTVIMIWHEQIIYIKIHVSAHRILTQENHAYRIYAHSK